MDEVQTASECLAFYLNNMYELSIGHVVRSADYDMVGGIPSYPNLLFADLELWMRVIEKKYRATSYQECCSYRVHPKSTTISSSELKYYHAFMRQLDFFIELKEKNEKFAYVLSKYGLNYLNQYCKSLSHHLLRIPRNKRKNVTVTGFLSEYKKTIDKLIPANNYVPLAQRSIWLAKQIDSNFLTRGLFLAFKKIYSKPILS